MTSSYIHLVEMGNAPVAGSDGNVFELDVHVVFGFNELPTEDLPGGKFKCANVTLCFVQQLNWDPDTTKGRHVCFSNCNLIRFAVLLVNGEGELAIGRGVLLCENSRE